MKKLNKFQKINIAIFSFALFATLFGVAKIIYYFTLRELYHMDFEELLYYSIVIVNFLSLFAVSFSYNEIKTNKFLSNMLFIIYTILFLCCTAFAIGRANVFIYWSRIARTHNNSFADIFTHSCESVIYVVLSLLLIASFIFIVFRKLFKKLP